MKPDIKILGLYMMDSIMKNLGSNTNYINIFERSVVNLFVKVFNCVINKSLSLLFNISVHFTNDLFIIHIHKIVIQKQIQANTIEPKIIKFNKQLKLKLLFLTFKIMNIFFIALLGPLSLSDLFQ